MGTRMTGLTRSKTGAWVARKGIPADVREAYAKAFGPGWEAKKAWPSKLSHAEAKVRFGEWLSEVENRIQALRDRAVGKAQSLTQKQARALAGEWYGWFTAPYEDSPGAPEPWIARENDLIENIDRLDPDGMYQASQGGGDLEPVLRDNLKAMRPYIDGMARVPEFVASKGLVLTQDARNTLLDYIAFDYLEVLSLLRRRAEGDFGKDEYAGRFPVFVPPTKAQHGPWAIFEAWVKARKPAASTIDRWRSVFQNLEATFKDTITEDMARAWSRKLITKERSARTVRDTWVGAATAVYEWALNEKLVRSNPFANVTVTAPRKTQLRESKAFTAEEAAIILRAASASKIPARRWVPWLQAYTGARAGEITQLRGVDIVERDSVWCLNLTPEAGTMKTGQARLVPIHEHLIAQGFLDFAKPFGKQPLFAATREPGEEDPLNPKRAPAVQVRDLVAAWVRSLGITDKELSPTHSWRHTFKKIADRVGISERTSDAITGHSPRNASRGYGRADVTDKAAALAKFPRYEV